jgi:hypothetical protein
MDSEDDFWDDADMSDDGGDDSDGGGADSGGDSPAAPVQASLSKRRSMGPWRVLENGDIEQERGCLVDEIMSISSLNRSAAICLLMRYE